MALPPEVLVTAMRVNQKYLALETPDGKLADRFVLVANMEADDGGAAIVAGNERVLRARLWDARFFWEQDRKRPLESRVPKLDRMVFHAELGMLGEQGRAPRGADRRSRSLVPGADRARPSAPPFSPRPISSAAWSASSPSFRASWAATTPGPEGEPEDGGGSDRRALCAEGAGRCLSDSPGERCRGVGRQARHARRASSRSDDKPTGSKDPFALRRAALGVLRLMLENGLRLPLRAAFLQALDGLWRAAGRGRPQAVTDDLLAFFADRLKVHLRGEGVRHDLIAAMFAAGGDDDLVRLVARVEALQAFLEGEDGRNLLAGYRRASSIVRIEEKKDKRRYTGAPDRRSPGRAAERELHAALERAEGHIAAALQGEDFALAMAALAALRRPIDAFFDRVMVNVPDNRSAAEPFMLLSRIRSALDAVADFSLIEELGRTRT